MRFMPCLLRSKIEENCSGCFPGDLLGLLIYSMQLSHRARQRVLYITRTLLLGTILTTTDRDRLFIEINTMAVDTLASGLGIPSTTAILSLRNRILRYWKWQYIHDAHTPGIAPWSLFTHHWSGGLAGGWGGEVGATQPHCRMPL